MPPKLDSNIRRIRESTTLRPTTLHIHRVKLIEQAKKVMQQTSKSPPLSQSHRTILKSASIGTKQ